MKSYPLYKSTNERFWNSSIPSDWEIKRISSVFTQRNEKVSDTEYEPLSVTKKGIFQQWENVAKSDSHDDRKLVLKNDFVINSRSDRRGSSGLSNYDGSVSLINTVLIPVKEVEPKYSEFMFKSYEFINEFYKNGRGIVDDLWSTKYSLMKNIYICLPPISEQKQIVSFLDRKTQKIDELIDKTEQKIELLKEKRTFLINHCVTKGLNPNVEMKDSGVPACAEQREAGGEWIGEIPSHWIKIKLFYITELITDGEHISPNFTNGGVPFLSSKDVYDGGVNINVDKFVSIEESIQLRKRCNPEYQDILIVSRGAKIGRVSIVNTKKVFCLLGSVILLKLVEKVNNRFVFFLLSSNKILEELILLSGSSAQPAIYLDDLRYLQIPLPPINEQKQIVEYLDEQTQKIDTTIEKETQRIELLKEYRQSLISEVVTGKIDVRGYNSTVLVEGETQSR